MPFNEIEMSGEVDKAIKHVARYAPCAHFNYTYSLGDSTAWMKCIDCNETFKSENLLKHRKEYLKFIEQITILKADLRRIKNA